MLWVCEACGSDMVLGFCPAGDLALCVYSRSARCYFRALCTISRQSVTCGNLASHANEAIGKCKGLFDCNVTLPVSSIM